VDLDNETRGDRDVATTEPLYNQVLNALTHRLGAPVPWGLDRNGLSISPRPWSVKPPSNYCYAKEGI